MLAGGEEFRRLAGVINSLLERLDLAFRAQKRHIADAAHELKTPTAILVGEAQEASPDATESQRHESLETVQRVARALAREVDSLLLLARGDASTPSKRTTFDFSELVDEAVESTEPLGVGRSVRCTFERLGPAWVNADAAGLSRVASNLIANAVLYTAPGSVVEITAGSDGNETFLQVADRGPGVAPTSAIASSSDSCASIRRGPRNPEGSGLGLAIVDQVVRAHRGRIEVEERPGGGAVFRAVLSGGRRPERGGIGNGIISLGPPRASHTNAATAGRQGLGLFAAERVGARGEKRPRSHWRPGPGVSRGESWRRCDGSPGRSIATSRALPTSDRRR